MTKLVSLKSQDLNYCVRRIPTPVRGVLEAWPHRFLIGGGFVRSCVAREPINDVDIFVNSAPDAHALAAVLLKAAGHATVNDLHTTANAVTLKCFHPAVQIVHRWNFPTAEKMLEAFDFTIAQAAIWCRPAPRLGDGVVWNSLASPEYYSDLAAKRLVYAWPKDAEPGGSLLRLLKYYRKGYLAPLATIAAITAATSLKYATDGDAECAAAEIEQKLHEIDPNVNDPITGD